MNIFVTDPSPTLSARVFKKMRDVVAKNETYVRMRKQWRSNE